MQFWAYKIQYLFSFLLYIFHIQVPSMHSYYYRDTNLTVMKFASFESLEGFSECNNAYLYSYSRLFKFFNERPREDTIDWWSSATMEALHYNFLQLFCWYLLFSIHHLLFIKFFDDLIILVKNFLFIIIINLVIFIFNGCFHI